MEATFAHPRFGRHAPSPARRAAVAIGVVAALVLGSVVVIEASTAREATPAEATQRSAQMLSDLPLSFVENAGQVEPDVAYSVPGVEMQIDFTQHGPTYRSGDGAAIEQRLLGAATEPMGIDKQEATFSWFKGDPSDWVVAGTYGAVRYEGVWPGVDVVYSGTGSELKYRFVVAPHADASSIRFSYPGTDVALTPEGDLRVGDRAASFVEKAPVTYQGTGSARSLVSSSYVVNGSTVSLALGKYDRSQQLVIDPLVMVYAGFIGGDGHEWSGGIAVDSAGAAYIAGQTDSLEPTFPEISGPDLTSNGYYDAFVAKVNPSGTALSYASFLGGDNDESAMDISVDGSGAAYVTGWTYSDQSTFPVIGGLDGTANGGEDAFITKIVPGGAGLAYSGFIGGNGYEEGFGVAVDGSGAAYVTGFTDSDESSFPVNNGPDVTFNGGYQDAFIVKVSPAGSTFTYAGYIGGAGGYDEGRGIAVDASGAAYVTGETDSDQTTFPTIVGPDLTQNGGDDAFVVKVAPSGSSFNYAGFIGGADYDLGHAIAVDPSGSAYVVGETYSDEASFPAIVGPDLTYNGDDDAFITKVGSSGSGLDYSGFIGGEYWDYADGVAVRSGVAYVAGYTSSDPATFPVVGALDPINEDWDEGFYAEVNTGGTGLLMSSYFGGADGDEVTDIAVDPAGAIYLTGHTYSDASTFPDTVGPDLSFNGYADAFVAKINLVTAPPAAPTGVYAVAAQGSAIVSWTPPPASPLEPLMGYTITSSPGGIVTSVGGEAISAGVQGLTDGTPYTFTVQAMNGSGTGPASSPTAPVTPQTSADAKVWECDAACTGKVVTGAASGSVTAPSGGPADVVFSMALSYKDTSLAPTPQAVVPCPSAVCLDVAVEPADAFGVANPLKIVMVSLARGLKPTQRRVYKDAVKLKYCTTKGVLNPTPACINSITKAKLNGRAAHKVIVLATSADPRYRTR